MSKTELYRFEINEFVNLCQSEKQLNLIYHFIKGFSNHSNQRQRTDAEIKARANFYGMPVKDVCR